MSEVLRKTAQELDAKRFGLPEGYIQPGTILTVSIMALAYNEALVGAEPKKFCPMRYAGENREDFWPAHKFLPFGHGPHQCPAWWLYKEVAIQVIAYLAYHYDWVSNPDGTVTPVRRHL